MRRMSRKFLRRCGGLAAVAVILVGALLRAYGLSTRDFWTDEAGRIATAKEPLNLLWADMFGHEQTPPLHYLLVRAVIWLVGDSLISYRLLFFAPGLAEFSSRGRFAGSSTGRREGLSLPYFWRHRFILLPLHKMPIRLASSVS